MTPQWQDELPKHIQGEDLVVPPDSYFGMGDNRDVACDSRFWGFVPRENVIGRPMFIYWSFETPPLQYLQTGLGNASDLWRRWLCIFSTDSLEPHAEGDSLSTLPWKFWRTQRGIVVLAGIGPAGIVFRPPRVQHLRNRITAEISMAVGRQVEISAVNFRLLPRPGLILRISWCMIIRHSGRSQCCALPT